MNEEIKKIKINEIYYTFSGEGKTKGLPVVIVRTTGCNLKCSYCDSKFAYEEGEELTFDEIIQKIKECSLFCNRILLTGSEPLFAPNCFDFIKFIHGVGKEIILETNGSFSIYKYLPYIKTICMDVKCPSSGMEGKTHWLNFNYLRPQDEVKFVIGNFEDFTYARTVVLKYQNRINQSQCVFSPAWGKIEPRALAEWILDDQLDVRFSLQEHKVIWGDKRGT